MIKVCKMCGESFETNNNAQRYCSQKCINKHAVEARKMKCPVCGMPFYSRNGIMYCSEECECRATKKIEDYHSESLDWKAKHWGVNYGKFQAEETLKLVGKVKV